MVRIATVSDAEQLNILNNEFNGEGETSIGNIRNSLVSYHGSTQILSATYHFALKGTDNKGFGGLSLS